MWVHSDYTVIFQGHDTTYNKDCIKIMRMSYDNGHPARLKCMIHKITIWVQGNRDTSAIYKSEFGKQK